MGASGSCNGCVTRRLPVLMDLMVHCAQGSPRALPLRDPEAPIWFGLRMVYGCVTRRLPVLMDLIVHCAQGSPRALPLRHP